MPSEGEYEQTFISMRQTRYGTTSYMYGHGFIVVVYRRQNRPFPRVYRWLFTSSDLLLGVNLSNMEKLTAKQCGKSETADAARLGSAPFYGFRCPLDGDPYFAGSLLVCSWRLFYAHDTLNGQYHCFCLQW